MATRSIVTYQPDVACDVCGRRLLRGEQPDTFIAGGRRRTVCELCVPRATHEGWLRESEAHSASLREPRVRSARSLLDRLRTLRAPLTPEEVEEQLPPRRRRSRGRTERPRPATERDVYEDAYLDAGYDAPRGGRAREGARRGRDMDGEVDGGRRDARGARRDTDRARRGLDGARRDLDLDVDADVDAIDFHADGGEVGAGDAYEQDAGAGAYERDAGSHAYARDAGSDGYELLDEAILDDEIPTERGSASTSGGAKAERALRVFNASPCASRIAGIARALGQPCVSVRPIGESGSSVAIVVAWELCWYRYEVDLGDELAGPQLVAEGMELDELPAEDKDGNAIVDERGEVSLVV